MSDITDEDLKDPWFMLAVTATAGAAAAWILLSFALDMRAHFPDRHRLMTSQGTAIAVERYGRSGYVLRLSDSERWYGSPAVGERVRDAARERRREPPIVSVLHAAKPSAPPADGSRWHVVAAYAVTMGDRPVVTYDETRARHDEHETTEYWLGVFFAACTVLFAYWTYGAYRNKRARPERK